MAHALDTIDRAERAAKNGGEYRPLLLREIDGKKCRCYARVVTIDTIEYWSVEYVINGKVPESFCDTISKMYDMVYAKVQKLIAKGKDIILWRY